MDHFIRNFFILAIASTSTLCQELPVNYDAMSIAGVGAGMCPDTQSPIESVRQDIDLLINNSILPALGGYGGCDCGGPGWRRAAYLNMSDPTQTCPPAWRLITTPRRSCTRPSDAGSRSCYSAMFNTQGIQYSQVCGRISGYQFGHPGAFFHWNFNLANSIDDQYVDGVSLTYGNPRKHIWTFAAAADDLGENLRYPVYSLCPCSNISSPHRAIVPSFVGSDYFCETGVPPGQSFAYSTFYPDDPLWDGQGCGPTSACCTFNNPPWFCKQLPLSTNATLEVRLCFGQEAVSEDTPIQLIELYVK